MKDKNNVEKIVINGVLWELDGIGFVIDEQEYLTIHDFDDDHDIIEYDVGEATDLVETLYKRYFIKRIVRDRYNLDTLKRTLDVTGELVQSQHNKLQTAREISLNIWAKLEEYGLAHMPDKDQTQIYKWIEEITLLAEDSNE